MTLVHPVRKLATVALCAAALAAGSAGATVITFTGGTAGSDQGAIATFDFSGNNLTLTLTNTSNITSIASILDDFHFTLGTTPLSASITGGASGGQETCTTSTGAPPHITTCTFDPNTSIDGTWGLFLTGDHVDMFSNGNQDHPFGIVNDTFITNASLDGLTNAQHNPVLLGPVTFNITFTGLSDTTLVGGVDFTFGTAPLHVPGTCTSGCDLLLLVPEPNSLALLGLGLGLLGMIGFTRRAGGG